MGDKAEENPLRDDRGFLWGGNALVSGYTEKDQVTVIANAQNIDDSGMVFAGMDDEGAVGILSQGLTTYAQLGFNANTSRIKEVESTVSVNYRNTDTDSGNRADRTTYLDSGNLKSSSQDRGKQYANSVNANMELKKEKGDFWFRFRPSFKYGRTDNTLNNASETFREGRFVNSSEQFGKCVPQPVHEQGRRVGIGGRLPDYRGEERPQPAF